MNEVTYDMLEKAAQVQLERIEKADPETKEGKDALAKAVELVNLLISTDKIGYDYHDREERRRIDEEKNKSDNQTEIDKQKLTWSKVGLEMAKAIVPLAVSMIGYNVFQKRLMRFEETGRVCSTAGRELHLPKFMK